MIMKNNIQYKEHAIIKNRVRVELEWLKFLIQKNMVTDERGEVIKISPLVLTHLDEIHQQFDNKASQRVKDIEKITNHDVKAVEYYIKEQLNKIDVLQNIKEYVHFCCTSEDISNLAYALMLQDAKSTVLKDDLSKLQNKMIQFSEKYADLAMLGRTHGQVASPTTMGKEVANFTYRISRQIKQIQKKKFMAKSNGAVGNFNAHLLAYPEYDWPVLSRQFIEGLGLEFNPYTTQIEPHDSMCEFYNSFSLLNTILLGFSRDMWNYISIGYFRQKTKKQVIYIIIFISQINNQIDQVIKHKTFIFSIRKSGLRQCLTKLIPQTLKIVKVIQEWRTLQ
ncbi:L-Aspartase-like protein [Pseudocohnilembus persalinus]|uniref:L-Aspartase-like protein n=1 Tax=Pseudocohnilembus persalinus TaxID=266149 RepID=A0A0V0R119_PSEPJ|nr:L-Aspartase-like protein [Pseudocohnilembus persalinus]|eukprot:KRX08215.1 L-Aspartase-like protein [Pseudocohnilembus persalinus]